VEQFLTRPGFVPRIVFRLGKIRSRNHAVERAKPSYWRWPKVSRPLVRASNYREAYGLL